MSQRLKRLNTVFAIIAVIILVAWFVHQNQQEERLYACDDKIVFCDLSDAKYHDASLPVEERVADLLSHMTVAEKIGQLALVERSALEGRSLDILDYNIGAVLSGGGSHPEKNNPVGWQAMISDMQSVVSKTRLQIPLLYGVDAVHGNAIVRGATVFPHQIALAAADDTELTEKVYAATSEELAALGINWNFAPAVDVVKDHRWGRTYETFGNETERVTEHSRAAVSGIQQSGKVSATAKHYLGSGAMEWNSGSNEGYKMDQGEVRLDEERLRADHLPPFREAIAAGVGSIMAGLNSWHGKKISADPYLLSVVLKDELGFEGLVVSDWFGVYEIPGNDYYNTASAIMAGIDIVMLPYDYPKFRADMEQSLLSGRLTADRLDDAVARILRLKFHLGLFEQKPLSVSDLAIIGSPSHRELAREAVRRSLVKLKDEEVLPLKKNASFIIAGASADNVGRQSGGWTIEWQGVEGNPLPGATSIYAGIKQALPLGAKVYFDIDGNFNLKEKADYGIAIVGEKPYAEGVGDLDNPRLSEEDLAAIDKVRAASEKLIVIIVSGRPLDIKREAVDWDAIIAAWLPGSEGQGVADVLFGDYPFTGRLPIPWDL